MFLPDHGSDDRSDDQRLDGLFHAYRDACVAPEPGANFMPELWQRIESRQRVSSLFTRMASGFVTAAVAVSMVMAFFVVSPSRNAAYSETYVEALADSHAADNSEFYEPVHLDSGTDIIIDQL